MMIGKIGFIIYNELINKILWKNRISYTINHSLISEIK